MNIKIQKAKQRMVQDHPFHACLLYRLNIAEAAGQTQTMATDGKSIFFNPAWVDGLTVAEVAGVLAHECMHVAYGHHLRKGDRDHSLWNQACDYAINEGLVKAGFKLPADGLFNVGYRDQAAERIYSDMLKEQAKAKQDDQGDQSDDDTGDAGQGAGGNEPDSGDDSSASADAGVPWGEVLEGVDDDGNALDEAGKAEAERELASAIHQAAQVERKCGTGKSDGIVRNVISSLQGDHQPWHQILNEALRDSVVTDQSYARPNRRLLHRGLVLPSDLTEPNGEIVIGIDTSGSLTSSELGNISNHINDIIADINPIKVHVVYCDFTVQHSDEYDRGDEVTLTMHGGGGTAFNPVFNWCDYHDITPSALIYFTDGCGDVGPSTYYGDKFNLPEYPVFWVTHFLEPQFSGCDEFGEIIKAA